MSTKNKLADFLNIDLPAPKMSNVDLTHSNRLTMSPGYIYPTGVFEVLPGDRFRLNLKTLLKSDPTVASLYGSFRQSHQAYFVPTRLYVKALDQNSTFNDASVIGITSDDYPYLPQVAWLGTSEGLDQGIANGIIDPGSLLENLGMFPTGFKFSTAYQYDEDQPASFHGLRINAVPLVGYYDILRNYYFNAQEPLMPTVYYETLEELQLVEISKHDLDVFISNVYENADGFDILQIINNDLGFNLWDETEKSFTTKLSEENSPLYVHSGYGVRTFDDDYFTTFLSNEFVDQIDNVARVVVDSSTNTFSVNQMRRAYRLDKHNNRNLLGGGNSYDDYIYVHFNTSLGRELNKPYFLGSYSDEFYFDDIYAQAQTSSSETNGSLGDRASVLNASSRARDFVDFTAKEYGYVIVVSSIIPKIDYYRGIPKMYFKTNMADLYSPEFDAWGYQGIPNIEVDALSSYGPLEHLNSTQMQPAWFEHMTQPNRVHGLFTSDFEHSFSVLTKNNDFFNTPERDMDVLRSSYIRPWNFNYIFEFQQSWYDHYTMQILFDCNVYRAISKQILPTL